MNREELLKKAAKDYPIGTKYLYVMDSSTLGSESIRVGELLWGTDDGGNHIYGSGWDDNHFNDCNVYKDGKWAEIIYSPSKNIKICKLNLEDNGDNI